MATYIELFLNLNTYIYDYRENKRNMEPLIPVSIHYYFEIGLIGAIKQDGQTVNLNYVYGIYIEI